MSNKKGFTLVEMMTVIVLISAILLLIVNAFTKTLANSKEKAYQLQIGTLEEAGKKWAMENPGSLSKTESYKLLISDLKEEGYIKDQDVVDPRDNSTMNGCIKIEYDNAYNQYTYEYTAESVICHPPV